MAIFIDELQYVAEDQLAVLITAMHRVEQQQLPVVLVGAGLPQLRGRMANAKSYAERLFNFPQIGALPGPAAERAIRVPLEKEGVDIAEAAVDRLVEVTHGYAYFLQQWGFHTWEQAARSPISIDAVQRASGSAVAALDESFFRVRFDRLTPKEKRYLRTMAELGPGPHRSGDIAACYPAKVTSLAPTRSSLIAKGMVWSPSHGDTAFTVPIPALPPHPGVGQVAPGQLQHAARVRSPAPRTPRLTTCHSGVDATRSQMQCVKVRIFQRVGLHMSKTLFLALFLTLSVLAPPPGVAQPRPNVVVIMSDDVAPFDISAYHRGLGAVHTPNIDRIAAEGLMLSDYYAQPSCTAGRAAFLTGQYPIRTGLTSVGQPGSPVGLRAEDVTIAQLLKARGYATAQFGKSHVGDRNEHLPTVHGFDVFYGFLYHLNMMEMPEQPEFPKDPSFVGRPRNVISSRASDRDDPAVDPRWGRVGRQIIEDGGMLGAERQKTFDDEVLGRSLDWMADQARQRKPFFLWFNPSRMHQEIHVSKQWEGKSGHGRYADALMHLDHLVGQVLKAIDDLGIGGNTIVLFTSDNGVNLSHWPSAGTAAFRGEKGTTWDGGFRVPMLVRWPGRVPAGQWSGGLMTAEDWLPTLLAAAGDTSVKADLLKGRDVNGASFRVHLDGYNQLGLLTGQGKSARREFFFFAETELTALRVDHWKVHLAIKDEWLKAAEKLPGGMLIDIKLDPFERTPESKGFFLWMKEKTWIAPLVQGPVNAFTESLKAFPPRQKGTGVGAAALRHD